MKQTRLGGWRRLAVWLTTITLTLAGPVAAVATPAAAQDDRLPRGELGALLDEMVAAGLPGAIGLARSGNDTWRGASGLAVDGSQREMRPTDRWGVGSMTKMAVATVVLQLAGEGRLGLDDPVERWLPKLVPNGRNITLRQLLNHSSGLYNYTDDLKVFKPYLDGNVGFTWTPRQLVKIAVKDHDPLFPPGDHHSYSNTGYVLLGLVIEKVTGTSLGTQLRRRVFEPLDLQGTSFAIPRRVTGSLVHGYLIGLGPDGGMLDATEWNPSWEWAAGAMTSTADDLARFLRALLRGRLLPSKMLDQMLTTIPAGTPGFRYGLGIAAIDTPCGTLWGHDGSDQYQTWVLNSRDADRQVVMMVNATDQAGEVQTLVLDQVARAHCLLQGLPA